MKRRLLTPTRVIMLGFLVSIIVGTILLLLPFSVKEGVKVSFLDALFVATSSVCVTGLSTINIGETFSFFGQLVLLLLIQFGGLGIVTFTTGMLLVLRKRISLSERLLIQNAYNLDTLSGLVRVTKKIFYATVLLEMIGAVFYMFVFVPEFGPRGIWYSIFHAVSAFCNAGIDLLGGDSFCVYRDNVIINFTTMFLIVVSGLGFPVYWDIIASIKYNRYSPRKHYIRKLSLHTKIVLSMTLFLIVTGCLLTLLFEHNNPATLGKLDMPHKVMASLFQSITLRTAGFATINQAYFRHVSCVVYIFWMFIGGSPAGTAGGVKTVTMALVFISMISNIRGQKEVIVFQRKISDDYIRRAMAIVCFSFTTLAILTVALMYVQDGNFLTNFYEMTSAVATVGLSRGLTGHLNDWGKLIVTLTMYLGRIGPITLALAFNSNLKENKISYAEGKVTIG